MAELGSKENYLWLNHIAGNSLSGEVRRSLNDGFGFYVQGTSFKHLQRLVKQHQIASVSAPLVTPILFAPPSLGSIVIDASRKKTR